MPRLYGSTVGPTVGVCLESFIASLLLHCYLHLLERFYTIANLERLCLQFKNLFVRKSEIIVPATEHMASASDSDWSEDDSMGCCLIYMFYSWPIYMFCSCGSSCCMFSPS